MPQVTTGATLLSADIPFPEVHELPREEGHSEWVLRKWVLRIERDKCGFDVRHAAEIGRPPRSGRVLQLFALSFVLSQQVAPLPAFSEDSRVEASRGRTGWCLSLFLKFFRSFWNSSIGPAPGKRLQ